MRWLCAVWLCGCLVVACRTTGHREPEKQPGLSGTSVARTDDSDADIVENADAPAEGPGDPADGLPDDTGPDADVAGDAAPVDAGADGDNSGPIPDDDSATDPDATADGQLPPTGDSDDGSDPAAASDAPADDDGDADDSGDAGPADDDDWPHTDPCTPGATVEPGTYTYDPRPVGGMKRAHRIAFHPDGTYALALEGYDGIIVYDWDSQTAQRWNMAPTQEGFLYWGDVVFDPSGAAAWIVGWWQQTNNTVEGRVYRFDDAAYRSGATASGAVAQLPAATKAGVELVAIARPWNGGNPVVLGRSSQAANHIAYLFELNTTAATFAGLSQAISSGSVGCEDLAVVNNEWGDPGIAVVCGSNGAQLLYNTQVAGGPREWRVNPGSSDLGNISRIEASQCGAYALAVSWSGRRIRWFSDGEINDASDAPSFSTQGVWGLGFQQDGQRALIVGQASGPNYTQGTVLEYRYGAYQCGYPPTPSCGIRDVSIPNFDMAPFNATSNAYLLDAAFRPGCDGGVIVGGTTSQGYLVEFQLNAGTECR